MRRPRRRSHWLPWAQRLHTHCLRSLDSSFLDSEEIMHPDWNLPNKESPVQKPGITITLRKACGEHVHPATLQKRQLWPNGLLRYTDYQAHEHGETSSFLDRKRTRRSNHPNWWWKGAQRKQVRNRKDRLRTQTVWIHVRALDFQRDSVKARAACQRRRNLARQHKSRTVHYASIVHVYLLASNVKWHCVRLTHHWRDSTDRP